jgi:hypothetical protein
MIYFKPQHNLDDSKLNRVSAYSYERVADIVLNGIQKGLIEKGYTEMMAEAFVTSKILRYELDGSWEDQLEKLGKKLASKVAESYFSDCEKWADEIITENI